MLRRRRKQDADDLVLHEAEPLGAAAAVTVLQQRRLRGGARGDHLGLEHLRDRGAEHILAPGVLFGQRIDRGRDPLGVEAGIGAGSWLRDDVVHALTRNGRGLPCHGTFWADSVPMLPAHEFVQSCSHRRCPHVRIFSLTLLYKLLNYRAVSSALEEGLVNGQDGSVRNGGARSGGALRPW